MDRWWWLGAILGIFGIAAGSLLGALMLLHPDWAGPIADFSAFVIVLCLAAAITLLVWPRKSRITPYTSGGLFMADKPIFDQSIKADNMSGGTISPTYN
ncbi:MAG: hypothetical protein ACTHKD_17610, partial [Devosia sp.]